MIQVIKLETKMLAVIIPAAFGRLTGSLLASNTANPAMVVASSTMTNTITIELVITVPPMCA